MLHGKDAEKQRHPADETKRLGEVKLTQKGFFDKFNKRDLCLKKY